MKSSKLSVRSLAACAALLAGCGEAPSTTDPAAVPGPASASSDGGPASAPVVDTVGGGADAGSSTTYPGQPLPACPADLLAEASAFDVYSLGSLAYACSEFAGVVGAAQTVDLSRFGVRPSRLAGTMPFALAAGGALSLRDGQVGGGVEAGGVATLRNYTVEGDVRSGATIDAQSGNHRGLYERVSALAVDHGRVSRALLNAADRVAAGVTTTPVAPSANGEIVLKAPAGVTAFAVALADLQRASVVRVDAPADAFVVVDVRGAGAAALDGTSVRVEGGVAPSGVLVAMQGVTQLSLRSSTVQGTLLAPRARTTFANARVVGGLFVADLAANPAGATPVERMGTCAAGQGGGSVTAARLACPARR